MNDDDMYDYMDRLSKKNDVMIDNVTDNINSSAEYKASINMCTGCNTGEYIVEDTSKGIIMCQSCGDVLNCVIDASDDIRYNNDEGRNKQTRNSTSVSFFLPNSSLGTRIACPNNSRVKMLHNWNAMPYKERSLYLVLKEMHDICRRGNIVKCIEDDAKILYKNIKEAKHISGKNKGKNIITRGENKDSLVLACIFFACKRKNQTRSPKEIAKLADIPYRAMTRGCKRFIKLLSLTKLDYSIRISDPIHFITRFCKNLKIPGKYIDKCISIANNIQKLKIASMHTPFSIANSSVLLLSDLHKDVNVNRKYIALEFGVSEVTIVKTYKKLEQYKSILIDDELTNKIVTDMEINRLLLPIPAFLVRNHHIIISQKISSYSTKSNIKKIKAIRDNFDNYSKALSCLVDKDTQAIQKRYDKIIHVRKIICAH